MLRTIDDYLAAHMVAARVLLTAAITLWARLIAFDDLFGLHCYTSAAKLGGESCVRLLAAESPQITIWHSLSTS
jgi:hypothetical protein